MKKHIEVEKVTSGTMGDLLGMLVYNFDGEFYLKWEDVISSSGLSGFRKAVMPGDNSEALRAYLIGDYIPVMEEPDKGAELYKFDGEFYLKWEDVKDNFNVKPGELEYRSLTKVKVTK